jgi:hypothetical protein
MRTLPLAPLRICLPALLCLPACSIWHTGASLGSSVVVEPGATASVHVRVEPSTWMSLVMQGEGPGGVAFDARSPDGTSTASGVLGPGDRAKCSTTEGEITVTFTGGTERGTVSYTVHSEGGISVELK